MADSLEAGWTAAPAARVGLAVKQLSWGSHHGLLGVNTVREVFILREHQVTYSCTVLHCIVLLSRYRLTALLG